MRDILEELPHALLSDPTRESEDPGVPRELHDDDLVRPAAEEDLPVDAHRSKRSPLARHVEVDIDPFDPRQPTQLGLTLAVEGQRVRSGEFTIGFVHQGVERRAVGLGVDDVELASLLAPVAPGLITQLAMARAVERLASFTPDALTSLWRALAIDLVGVAEHSRALLLTMRRSPRLMPALAQTTSAADVALEGIDGGHRLGHPFGLRTAVPDDEMSTLRRRLDDIERALSGVDDARMLAALAHLKGAGVLDIEHAREIGIDGPALLAAGGVPTLAVDLGHDLANLHQGGAHVGCTVARVEVHLQLLRAAVQRLPRHLARIATHDGANHEIRSRPTSLSGTHDAFIYGPGGTTACIIDVQAGLVNRLRIRPPELPLLLGVSRALRGVRLDDVSEVVASFGLHSSALDR